jgi:hypothetical protein
MLALAHPLHAQAPPPQASTVPPQASTEPPQASTELPQGFDDADGGFGFERLDRAEASIAPSELRLLPPDPCMRLTLALSELDRQEARASCLASVRLANRQDRIDEGVLLLGFGVLSAIAGGVMTGVALTDGNDLLLSAGLGTAGWGVINAAFSAALFDLTGSGLRDIEDDRHLTSEALLRARDEAAAAQDQTAAIIAVNAGLDIAYIATGLLLYFLGEAARPRDAFLVGYGLAMTVQGGVLLAYDGVTWGFAADRASRLRALLRE